MKYLTKIINTLVLMDIWPKKKCQPKLNPKKNKVGSTDRPKHFVRPLMVA